MLLVHARQISNVVYRGCFAVTISSFRCSIAASTNRAHPMSIRDAPYLGTPAAACGWSTPLCDEVMV